MTIRAARLPLLICVALAFATAACDDDDGTATSGDGVYDVSVTR